MIVGALGGPGTFAAQAAEHLVGGSSLTYFPSAGEEWQALAGREIAALVMLAESSTAGPADLARRAATPDFPYYVAAEAEVPYGCLLLAKAGTAVGDIRTILGHGSIAQCKAYLDAHFRGVEFAMEQTSSLAAADQVARGDGSLALVGTARTAQEFGLEVLARGIDNGAVGRYWLVSREPHFQRSPSRLLVSARLTAEDELSRVVAKLSEAGYSLRTLAAWPTGLALYEYDYLLALAGQGQLETVQQALGAFPVARLLGAF